MKRIFGAMAASPGETTIPCETRCETVIIGPAFILSDVVTEPPSHVVPEADRETERDNFRAALFRSTYAYTERIKEAADNLPIGIREEAQEMLQVEMMMLQDSGMRKKIEDEIVAGKSAARASYDFFSNYTKILRQAANSKMRGMAEAVESVLLVVLQQLGHVSGATLADAPDGSIPVTPYLPVGMASFLRGADGVRIHGMVNSSGTDEDHTNIVARGLGVGIARIDETTLKQIENGDVIVFDGPNKKIVFNPEAATLESYSSKSQADISTQRALLQKAQGDNGVIRTRNGAEVKVAANISYSDEVDGVNAVNAAGIGLYRTELALQRANSVISEDKWHEMFSDVVSRTQGGKVIIRTADFDGDKANDSFDTEDIEEIVWRQINAALRVADEIGYGHVGVMIPVVTSASHLKTFQDVMDKEAARLGIEPIKLGAMVETSAFVSDLENADAAFFSLGTNDLIADIIGFNRFDREERNRLHDPTDPRVLAAIAATATAGDAKGIPVSVCGDLGSDPRYFALLTGAGIRSVSAGASAVPVMKEVVRRVDTAAAKKLFEKVMATPDRAERLQLLDEFNARELGLRNRSLDSGWTPGPAATQPIPQP